MGSKKSDMWQHYCEDERGKGFWALGTTDECESPTHDVRLKQLKNAPPLNMHWKPQGKRK